MVNITLEELWMVSDRIVNFGFFVKFHRSGPAVIFSFWTITEHVRKNVPNQAKIYQDFIMTVSFTLEGLWMVSDRIVDFRIFVKFHRSGPAIIFSFWTISEHVSYGSKKLPIKPRFIRTSSRWSVFLWKELWMVSDRIVDFQFFVKFHRSGPAIIFIFWTIYEAC